MELKDISMEKENNEYMIKIGRKVLLSTWAEDEQELKNWLAIIHKIYGKKNKKPLVVGLSTDRSTAERGKKRPYELLQLCVGNHCLLWVIELFQLDWFDYKKGYKVSKQPKELKDFLEKNKIMVVGVNVKDMVKKIEKETDLLIPKTSDLRELAEQKTENKGEYGKCNNVSALAKLVLGENMVVIKPNKLSWYSDDFVKLASIEAFLAAEMGSKLLSQ